MYLLTLRYLFVGILCLGIVEGHLDVLYKWRTVDFEYPSSVARENQIRNGDYVPGTNSLPLDVDVWYQDGKTQQIFLTFPKFQRGVPITLGTIPPRRSKGESPLVQAYPDWSWHSQSNCDGLTSVFRTQIDKCGRLWVIDSGMVDLRLPTRRRQCQPKLLAFYLTNGQLAGKHLFPDSVLRSNSLLTNVVVEVRSTHNECKNTFAYVADTMSYALLVLDVQENRSWRVESNSMYPYPPFGFFQTNNVEFDLMDGILGMAITPTDRDKQLFYHSLASVRESWVPLSVLKDEEYLTSNQISASKRFKTSEEAKRAQSIAQAFDKNGILYFGMVDNTLNCWNSKKPFTRENVHEIIKDNTNLQFASGLKVIPNEKGEEEIWVITNRFQITMVGSLNSNEINFRVLKGNVQDLIRNNQCKFDQMITFPNRTINAHRPSSSSSNLSSSSSLSTNSGSGLGSSYGYGR